MNITIHRGTHEIGGSCVELQSGSCRIVIDIGMPLVDKHGEKFNIKNYEKLKGQELVAQKILPDIKGFYKWDIQSEKVDGVLISHPHMDHYGFFNYLREDTTYYIGESAKKIIEMTCLFTSKSYSINNSFTIESGKPVTIGDFKITPYLMDHSAYDAYAFLIEAEGKKIIYSGDFREHGRKKKAFYYFLQTVPENIDVLILEGTMLGRGDEKVRSEAELEAEIDGLVKSSEGITLMNMSAQNIDRIVSMYRVAKRNKKLFVMDFYAANILSLLRKTIPHPSAGFPEVRVFYPYRLSKRMADAGHKNLLYKFQKYKITRAEIVEKSNDIMMLVRGTMLGDLNRLNIRKGLFLYSMWKGYLREESMKPVLEFVEAKDMDFRYVHTSGHAALETALQIFQSRLPVSSMFLLYHRLS